VPAASGGWLRWAHARRKIYDIHHSTRSPAAAEALERIAELFAIEAEIRGAAPATRLEARRRHTVPRLAALKDHLEATFANISRKSKLAEATQYATSRWEALCHFTQDGRLEMTNNAAERAIRPLALGRRNWTFAGSDAGGDRAAAFYTLTMTAKLNNVDPEAWLADVIDRIADHPASQLDDLLPWNWQAARQQKAA
jgi:transposase